jgi:hypothetical protein
MRDGVPVTAERVRITGARITPAHRPDQFPPVIAHEYLRDKLDAITVT